MNASDDVYFRFPLPLNKNQAQEPHPSPLASVYRVSRPESRLRMDGNPPRVFLDCGIGINTCDV